MPWRRRSSGPPTGPPGIEIHTRIEGLADEWRALAASVDAPLWLGPDWMAAWWRAFGTGELEIVAVREEGRLAGAGGSRSSATSRCGSSPATNGSRS